MIHLTTKQTILFCQTSPSYLSIPVCRYKCLFIANFFPIKLLKLNVRQVLKAKC